MPRAERGSALLEVLVAITILAMAGSSMVAFAAGMLRGELEMARREAELAAAERVLTASTLLTRQDLDRRIGRRRVGTFFVDVARPEPELYRIAVVDTLRPRTEQVVTVVYRPRGEGS